MPVAPRRGLGRVIGRLAPDLWPRDAAWVRRRVAAALVCLLVAKGVNILIPFALKGVVDRLSVPPDLIVLPLLAVLAYGGARIGAALFEMLRVAVFSRVAVHAGRRVALRTFGHLLGLSLRYHLERRTGELARSISRAVEATSFMLGMVLFSIVPTLVEFVLVIGILLVRYPWPFAAVTAGTILVYAAFTILFTEWRVRFRREMNALDNEASARTVDALLNYETVKTFTNEATEAARLDGVLREYEGAAARSRSTLAGLNFGQAAVVAIGVALVMLLAARGVAAGTMTVGDLVLMNVFLLQLYAPLDQLGMVYNQIKQALIDLEIIEGLMALAPEVADRPGAADLVLKGGAVRFDDVRFAYDPRRPVLAGVSFEVPAGRTVAVVGPSGAGKSTLARLLFRFYDAGGGAVRIDGRDVREVTQDSLRRAIGVVPQDTVLFNQSLHYNIAYGRPDAPDEAVRAAAEAARLGALLAQLPDGLATVVGERGLKLSGGEKQRVAIARMLLKNPPIVVLDEATSSLDTATEREIQGALDRLAEGRTTLVIAHRLSTVVGADRIVVLDGGRVAEEGPHEALLARGGVYADLWRRQAEASDAHRNAAE